MGQTAGRRKAAWAQQDAAPERLPVAQEHGLPPALWERWLERWSRVPRFLLAIGWPISLLAVTAIVAVGAAIAVAEPHGLIRSTNSAYNMGDYVDLRPYGNATPYLGQGWSEMREGGRRTAGAVADVVLPVDVSNTHALGLNILGRPVFAPQDDEFWVDVLLNGTPMTRWLFRRADQAQHWKETSILTSRIAPRDTRLHVTFVIGAMHPSGSGYEIEALALRK